MILLENVHHHFDDHIVFSNLNFSVEKKQIHALIGKTGAGKTLLLRLLASLNQIQRGKVVNPCHSIGYVFQTNSFFPWLKMRESLELTFQFSLNEVYQDIQKFRLESYLDQYPRELSGGTLQKFNLLRAFVGKPELLLMDEPFSHLDVVQREELHHFFLELWNIERPPTVIVSHDIDEAIKLSDKISFLSGKEKRITEVLDKSLLPSSSLYQKLYELLKSDLE
jgi:ABC-type nitrate/sulfonate/bicarbonate transport system ATPase subunit